MKDRLRDPALQLTPRDHATYPSIFFDISVENVGRERAWESVPSSRYRLGNYSAYAENRIPTLKAYEPIPTIDRKLSDRSLMANQKVESITYRYVEA